MMNESDYHWLNETPFSDDVWLSMLVDGELTVSQREEYVAYIRNTELWQTVATAFLDEQILTTYVAEPITEVVSVARPQFERRQPRRSWVQFLAMVACLVFGLIVGPWLQHSDPAIDVAEIPERHEPIFEDNPAPLESLFPGSLPGLYQVSDTVDEAVYYADFSVPQFMLDALVLAGHRVTFDQEFLGYTETSDNPAAVPINVIHIQKYGRLLATLK